MILSDVLLSGSIFILIGALAGLMAGAIGIGGGIIIVPGLVIVFQLNHLIPESIMMHAAAGTSLAIMIFTSLAAIGVHYKIGEILWSIFDKLWPGLVLGVISGVILADFVSTYWLEIIFGIFLLMIALRMIINLHVAQSRQFPGYWINGLISYLIGVLSGLLGVGGGVLIIPYLTYCGVDARKISAVSNLCALSVGTIGALVFMITGQKEMASISYSTGYIFWPAVFLVGISSSLIAPIGAKLNYVLPLHYLKYGFIVILLLTAIKMLF